MKTILVGSGAGVLASALALDRDGQQVLVIGDHGDPSTGYERADLSVLTRSGVLGSRELPEAFQDRLEHRQVLFYGNDQSAGFTIRDAGSGPSVFRSEELREWLLREARSSGVSLQLDEEATGLLRRNKTVVGVTTPSGPVTGDVVYLSENGFGWLTRNEEYGRSLPGEDPAHLVNVQATLPRPSSTTDSPVSAEIGHSETITSLFLSPEKYKQAGKYPPFVQVFPAGDRIVVDLILTRSNLRDRRVPPDDLMDRVLSSPVFEGISVDQDPTLELQILPAGGWSRRATLCDHGLALGGPGAGLMALWPDFDTIGSSLRSGYQFARTVSHLDRQRKFPGRDRLRNYYERPLSEGWVGQRMKQDEPIADRFVENGTLMSGGTNGLFEPEKLSLPDRPSLRTVTNALNELNFSDLSEWLDTGFLREAFELIHREGMSQFLSFFGSTPPVKQNRKPDSQLSSLLLGFVGRSWYRSLVRSGETGDKLAPTRALKYLLQGLDALNGNDPVMDTPSENIEKRNYQIAHGDSGNHGRTPEIHAGVSNSLRAEIDPFRDLETLCPSDVFTLKDGDGIQPEFEWNENRCVRCGLCRLGDFPVDFYGSLDEGQSTSRFPEGYRISVQELFDCSVIDTNRSSEQLYGVPRIRRRLELLLRSLREEPFCTPESRGWLDGQLNLIRSEFDEGKVGEIFPDFIDYAGREIQSIRRLFSRERDRFAHEKLRVLKRFFEELTIGDPEEPGSTRSSPSSNRIGGSEVSDSRDYKIDRLLSDFLQSIREFAQDSLSTTKSIREGVSVGFLRPDRADCVTVIGYGEVDRLLMHTEFGTRIFRPTDNPLNVVVQTDNGVRVAKYRREDLEPLESDAFLPERFKTTIEPFLESIFDLFTKMIRREAHKIRDENSSGFNDLRLGQLEALTVPLDQLKYRETDPEHQPDVSVVYRLLAGTDLLFDSLKLAPSAGPDGDNESSRTSSSIIRALVGSPAELIRAHDQSQVAQEKLSNDLSLSEVEEERWESADTSGIIHDAVRQWRTTLGTIRRVLRNNEGTDLQRSIFIVRTWVTRQVIDGLQKELETGASPRTETRSLDVLMKRLYWSRQPFDEVGGSGPDLSGSNPDSSTGSTDPKRGLETLINSVLDKKTSSFNKDLYSKFYDYLRNVLENINVEEIEEPCRTRELFFLLVEFRDGLYPETLRHDTSGSNPEEDLSFASFLRWFPQFVDRIEELHTSSTNGTVDYYERGLTLNSRLFDRFRMVMSRDSLREEVIRRTNEFREVIPPELHSSLDDRTVETVQRSLKFFESPVSQRPNLRGLWSQYLQLMARITILIRLKGNDASREVLPEELVDDFYERFEKDIQSHAKLFNHGVRQLKSDREPPESQIVDLLHPGSVFQRRYARGL